MGRGWGNFEMQDKKKPRFDRNTNIQSDSGGVQRVMRKMNWKLLEKVILVIKWQRSWLHCVLLGRR